MDLNSVQFIGTVKEKTENAYYKVIIEERRGTTQLTMSVDPGWAIVLYLTPGKQFLCTGRLENAEDGTLHVRALNISLGGTRQPKPAEQEATAENTELRALADQLARLLSGIQPKARDPLEGIEEGPVGPDSGPVPNDLKIDNIPF